LTPLPAVGRRFVGHAVVRLGDADPSGVMRFDAVGRMLQDVANDDAVDSGLPNSSGWIVRRTMIEVAAPAVLGEGLTLTTFCSGTGRCWAERRTSLVGDRGALVEAVSLWVQVDPATGRPAPLGDDFDRIYGLSAAGRVVSSKLGLDAPPADAVVRAWTVRRADLDVFGHVNNAVLWSLLEETIGPAGERRGVAEIEYPGPVDAGAVVDAHFVTGEHHSAWIVEGGRVRCAARWTPAPV
jgi:acyl-ACP thioesterase